MMSSESTPPSGYRFTSYLQGKLQYSLNHRDASFQEGEHLVAAQLTLKF